MSDASLRTPTDGGGGKDDRGAVVDAIERHLETGRVAFVDDEHAAAIAAFTAAVNLLPKKQTPTSSSSSSSNGSDKPTTHTTPDARLAARAFNNRGMAYAALELFDFAIRDFDASLKTAETAVAFHNRGDARRGKGQWRRAVHDHTRALALDPTHTVALNNRAFELLTLNRLGAAIADADAAIALAPRYAPPYLHKAAAFVRARRYGDAAATYRQLLSLRPKHAAATRSLKQLTSTHGGVNAADAAAVVVVAIDIDGGDDDDDEDDDDDDDDDAAACVFDADAAADASRVEGNTHHHARRFSAAAVAYTGRFNCVFAFSLLFFPFVILFVVSLAHRHRPARRFSAAAVAYTGRFNFARSLFGQSSFVFRFSLLRSRSLLTIINCYQQSLNNSLLSITQLLITNKHSTQSRWRCGRVTCAH
jgi:lipoprotein NlpI